MGIFDLTWGDYLPPRAMIAVEGTRTKVISLASKEFYPLPYSFHTGWLSFIPSCYTCTGIIGINPMGSLIKVVSIL